MTNAPDINQIQFKRAIRQLLASVARGPGGEEQSQDVASSLNRLSELMSDTAGADVGEFDNITAQLKSALSTTQDFSAQEIGKVLHTLGDLSEGVDRPQSLEDLANWFEENLGPVLNRRLGVESVAEQSAAIRESARGAIDAALQKHGIEAPDTEATPQSSPIEMTRHRLFWQNFIALAPALAPLLALQSGAAGVQAQLSCLLGTLDLPDQVNLSIDQTGARLDFAAPADAETAQVLQIILADAPVMEGWRFSIAGHEV